MQSATPPPTPVVQEPSISPLAGRPATWLIVTDGLLLTFVAPAARLVAALVGAGRLGLAAMLSFATLIAGLSYLVLLTFLPISWQEAALLHAACGLIGALVIDLVWKSQTKTIILRNPPFSGEWKSDYLAAVLLGYLCGLPFAAYHMIGTYGLEVIYQPGVPTTISLWALMGIPWALAAVFSLRRRFESPEAYQYGIWVVAASYCTIVIAFARIGLGSGELHSMAFGSLSVKGWHASLFSPMNLLASMMPWVVGFTAVSFQRIRESLYGLVPLTGFSLLAAFSLTAYEGYPLVLKSDEYALTMVERDHVLPFAAFLDARANRYPQAPNSCRDALAAAELYLKIGRKDRALAIYRQTQERYSDNVRWQFGGSEATAFLEAIERATSSTEPVRRLHLPVVGNREYLEPNWRVLMSALRSARPNGSETSFLLGLRAISRNSRSISLQAMAGPEDARSILASLGSESFYLPVTTEELKALLEHQAIVLLQLGDISGASHDQFTLVLLEGYDAERDAFLLWDFSAAPEPSIRAEADLEPDESAPVLRRREFESLKTVSSEHLQRLTQDHFGMALLVPKDDEFDFGPLGLTLDQAREQTRAHTAFSLALRRLDQNDYSGVLRILLPYLGTTSPEQLAWLVGLSYHALERNREMPDALPWEVLEESRRLESEYPGSMPECREWFLTALEQKQLPPSFLARAYEHLPAEVPLEIYEEIAHQLLEQRPNYSVGRNLLLFQWQRQDVRG